MDPLLILSIADSLRRLHFFLVLGPNEAAIHHGLTVVFKRYDCTSERYFLVAIFPRLIVELLDAAFDFGHSLIHVWRIFLSLRMCVFDFLLLGLQCFDL